jgi:hypothetical protein
VALFLCGCSQTTVHLYSRYLSDAQIAEINKELVKADFIVTPNYLAFPISITQSSLIYSPVIQDHNAVDTITNGLSNIGWKIHHTSMLFTDNHWYKENSIALMLLPPGVNPHTQTQQQDWANEYTSQNCELTLTIKLNKNGQYQILSAKNKLLQHEDAKGHWEIRNFPYLELRSGDPDWALFFEVKQYIETDQMGDIHISELVPLSNYIIFGGCSFIHGLRDNL